LQAFLAAHGLQAFLAAQGLQTFLAAQGLQAFLAEQAPQALLGAHFATAIGTTAEAAIVAIAAAVRTSLNIMVSRFVLFIC